jgi:hypothetical protein
MLVIGGFPAVHRILNGQTFSPIVGILEVKLATNILIL